MTWRVLTCTPHTAAHRCVHGNFHTLVITEAERLEAACNICPAIIIRRADASIERARNAYNFFDIDDDLTVIVCLSASDEAG